MISIRRVIAIIINSVDRTNLISCGLTGGKERYIKIIAGVVFTAR